MDADHCIADEAYCDYVPTISGSGSGYDCSFFNKIIFGTGLKVSGTGDCAYRIEADHYIRGTGGTCVTGNISEYQFFNKLDFRSGLVVTNTGTGCEYIIDASLACIADEGYCDYTPSGSGCNVLDKLIAGTGLKVSHTGGCAYRIEADHYIKDSGACGTKTATYVDGEGTKSMDEYQFFNKLIAGTGLAVEWISGCEYSLHTHHKVCLLYTSPSPRD